MKNLFDCSLVNDFLFLCPCFQAGGAPSHNVLSTAITSIQEALKNSDWATRKSACAALGEIASSGGMAFGSFKSSCIRCLESCRFDKVSDLVLLAG